MTRIILAVFTAACIGLAGCGGGGSGTGAGQASIIPGTYTGTVTATIMILGAPDYPISFGFTLVIRADGTFSYTSDSGATASGIVANNTIILTEDLTIADPGLSCSGRAVYSIFLTGDRFTGTIGGDNVVCNGISIRISGSIAGSRTGASLPDSHRSTSQGLDSIRNALRRTR